MTWSLFGTLDNPNDPVHPCPVSEMQFLASSEGGLVGQSSTQWSQCSWTPLYVRLGILGTGSGRITIVQFGSVPQ
jgi:hypothetical protein